MNNTHHTATTELQKLVQLRSVLAEKAPTADMRTAADNLAEVFADILAAPYISQLVLLRPATDALKQILAMEGHNTDDHNNDQ